MQKKGKAGETMALQSRQDSRGLDLEMSLFSERWNHQQQ